MNIATLLAFASAIFGFAMAFSVLWKERRSATHLAFAAGLVILALESIFNGLSLGSLTVTEVAGWQKWRLATTSFLPGVWLFFSLTYSRGNHREFLARWKLFLTAFLLAAPALGIFGNLLDGTTNQTKTGYQILGLSKEGDALNLIFLVGIVLVLMNLERTFRAAVGTMRWRIKFMILGLGILFIVRVYTSTETLLFHSTNLSLQLLDCGALLVGCLLIFRALLREGHFNVDVYPSHAVLHNSLTVLLAGIYLLIIGLFAKIVTYLGGDEAFTIKAFLVLAALVVLTILLLSDRDRKSVV